MRETKARVSERGGSQRGEIREKLWETEIQKKI